LITIDPAIAAELENWAAWCRSGPWPHPIPPDTAASAEGKYVDPSDLYAEPPRPKPPRPNDQRAEVVQRVYMTELTPRERRVMAGKYVRREPEIVLARRLRITVQMVEADIMRIARRVGAAFRMEAV